METEDLGFVYIGRKQCGCVPRILVDRPEYKDDTAASIAEWIRDGFTIEHLPHAEGVNQLKRCRCNE